MNRHVVVLPGARGDLRDQAVYLGRRSRGTDRRFLAAVDRSLARFAQKPGLGAPFETANPRLANLRCETIDGFPNHSGFSLTTAQGIEVVRVLHGAQDLDAILDDESGRGEP